MVSAVLHLVVAAAKRKEVLQILRPGCRSCRVYQDLENANALLLLQEWSTSAALTRYLRSDLYRAILAVMESASESPELRFDTNSDTAGVELVKVVRGVT